MRGFSSGSLIRKFPDQLSSVRLDLWFSDALICDHNHTFFSSWFFSLFRWAGRPELVCPLSAFCHRDLSDVLKLNVCSWKTPFFYPEYSVKNLDVGWRHEQKNWKFRNTICDAVIMYESITRFWKWLFWGLCKSLNPFQLRWRDQKILIFWVHRIFLK